MENTLTLKAPSNPVFQLHTQNSHPKVSLRRVLWVRFLRWLDKASLQAIGKAARRCATCLLVSLAIFIPQHLLGILTSAARWHGFRIPLFLALLYVTLNARRLPSLWRWIRRTKPAGNQSLYHGLPASELASFLKETESFKLDDVRKTFGISQDKWKEVAGELERRGVLVRGKDNARVLRPISYVNLVRQLAEKFPLVWDPDRELWIDRDGPFDRWVLSQEFSRKKLEEATAKKERKLQRIEKQIEQAQSHPLFAGLAV